MVLAGVTSCVEVDSTSGMVALVSISFSRVVTATGVEPSVSVSIPGVGVLSMVVGIFEMVVSIVIGVGAGLVISV